MGGKKTGREKQHAGKNQPQGREQRHQQAEQHHRGRNQHHGAAIQTVFSKFFRFGKVIVEHDISAVALATCEDRPGIVAILSSGSNAAYFNGKKIKENNYGLGFILADEGSSNWMGRHLLKSFLTKKLPAELEQKFVQKYPLDKKTILDKVYRHIQPTLFLSSFIDFLFENRKEEYVNSMVLQGFDEFFIKYIIPLSKKYPTIPINFAGTVAWGFKEELMLIAEQRELPLNTIIKDPILNVLNYYINKN